MGKLKELEGRTCVVTGAARSIGLAIAEAFKAEGARVVMIDINPAVLDEAKRMGEKGYILDITDQKAVLACFEKIASEFGTVYTLVNTAGIVDQRPIEEMDFFEVPENRALILEREEHRCFYCLRALTNESYVIEHVLSPLARAISLK